MFFKQNILRRGFLTAVTALPLIASTAVTSVGLPIAVADDITITVRHGNEDTQSTKPPFTGQRATVDVAILLDTSNSMDGLIDQARSQLWNIVQQFAEAKKAGQTPLLRVAVMQYGNSGLPATENYIAGVVAMTDDLDAVSEGLFELTTNGGDEYCGAVIGEAIKRLDWSSEPGGYKAIFIAGNEPFDQGSIDYAKACRDAIGRGIVVNTIHCGSRDAGVAGHWADAAKIAEGKFMNINQDVKVVHIKAPQDELIIKLNAELNQTYRWFGSQNQRQQYEQNQIAQDSNALGFGGLSGRAAIKSSSLYRNVGRDIVDTYEADADAVLDLEEEQLPESLRGLDAEQRKKKIEALAERRRELQTKLAELNRQRTAFVAKKRAQTTPASASTFGDAFAEAVAEQLDASGFDAAE